LRKIAIDSVLPRCTDFIELFCPAAPLALEHLTVSVVNGKFVGAGLGHPFATAVTSIFGSSLRVFELRGYGISISSVELLSPWKQPATVSITTRTPSSPELLGKELENATFDFWERAWLALPCLSDLEFKWEPYGDDGGDS
jgi:hypothetical protein